MTKVRIGGDEQSIADFSGRKALTAGRMVREILRAWPEVLQEQARFRRQYEADNVVELDRATAMVRYGPAPLTTTDGEIVRDGGDVVMIPGQASHLTEQDWQANGQKLRLPAQPTREELFVAMFPMAFERAEDQVSRLLALAVVRNDELGDAARSGGSNAVDQLLRDKADELLDRGSLPELMELAVVAAEMVHEQVTEKLDELGERTGKLLRLFGLGRGEQATTDQNPAATTESSSEQRQDSSTPSLAPTDGTSEPPSTTPALSSSSS